MILKTLIFSLPTIFLSASCTSTTKAGASLPPAYRIPWVSSPNSAELIRDKLILGEIDKRAYLISWEDSRLDSPPYRIAIFSATDNVVAVRTITPDGDNACRVEIESKAFDRVSRTVTAEYSKPPADNLSRIYTEAMARRVNDLVEQDAQLMKQAASPLTESEREAVDKYLRGEIPHVTAGKVEIGMPAEEALRALGAPDRDVTTETAAGRTDEWHYGGLVPRLTIVLTDGRVSAIRRR